MTKTHQMVYTTPNASTHRIRRKAGTQHARPERHTLEETHNTYADDMSAIMEILDSIDKRIANLENCTGEAQNHSFLQEGVEELKKRQRVVIGYNDDGSSIVKHISADNSYDMNDRIVQEYVKSGRIWEFIPKPNNAVQATTSNEAQEETNVCKYIKEWYPRFRGTPTASPKTIHSENCLLRKHIYPFFAGMTIEQLAISDIQRFLDENKHYAKSTLRTMRNLIRQAFDMAVEDGIIRKNPAASKKIKLPSEKVTPRKVLTLEQYVSVLSDIDRMPEGNERRYIALLAHTGIRKGELLGMHWEDINISEGTIHIKRQVTFAGNQPIVKDTKTKNGVRIIGINKRLAKLLEPIQASGYVIARENGEPLTQQAEIRMRQRISKQVNTFGVTPHGIRHSYLSMLSEAGVEPKTIQAVGGHSDFRMTMDNYVHKSTKRVIEAANAADNYVRKRAEARKFCASAGENVDAG